MPKQAYAIAAGDKKRLEIAWKMGWKDITVSFDGNTIGTIPDQQALSAGQEFPIPDGSTIKIQLVSKFSSKALQILRNGQPLPGSASDPLTQVKSAYQIAYFVAGLNLVLGFASIIFTIEFLQNLGIGFFLILFGMVFLVLAFFTQRRSSIALILAIVILALDGIIGAILLISRGNSTVVGGLAARFILIIPMVQGIGAIKALKQQKKSRYM
jgi:hypothetical protein